MSDKFFAMNTDRRAELAAQHDREVMLPALREMALAGVRLVRAAVAAKSAVQVGHGLGSKLAPGAVLSNAMPLDPDAAASLIGLWVSNGLLTQQEVNGLLQQG